MLWGTAQALLALNKHIVAYRLAVRLHGKGQVSASDGLNAGPCRLYNCAMALSEPPIVDPPRRDHKRNKSIYTPHA
jgi:hypothetical protein